MADVDSTGMPFTKENPYGWSKKYSVIYVDSPVGTGFSFTGTFFVYLFKYLMKKQGS